MEQYLLEFKHLLCLQTTLQYRKLLIYGLFYHSIVVKNITLKQSLLTFLIEHKDEEFSIRELSVLLQKDYKNVYYAIQDLSDSISSSKKGQATFIRFLPVLTPELYQAELARKKALSSTVPLLIKDIELIDNPFFIAVLFGSYAKKTHTKHSDIDVCIIHNDSSDVDQIVSRLRIHQGLELHLFHYSEFLRMLESKKFNVAHEIVKDGIVLSHIEGWYKVISNAQATN